MITEFVAAWDARKDEVRAKLAEKHPDEYIDIVRAVVSILTPKEGCSYGKPDPNRIHQIDDGDYQGTLVFVVGCEGYQPSTYWYVRIYYGSCSGCDTLQAISSYSSEPPTDTPLDEYMTLALHALQGLKQMDGEAA